MALIYYSKASYVGARDSFNPLYDQLTITTNPNTILYFDSSSNLNAISYSGLYITCSYAVSASYASNAGGGGTNLFDYTTIYTSSTNWITVSLLVAEQLVNITNAALYNFTCSDPPTSQIAYASLYINNTSLATSSLSFPSNWVFMGAAPTSLSASKDGILSIKSFGGSPNVAAFAVQY